MTRDGWIIPSHCVSVCLMYDFISSNSRFRNFLKPKMTKIDWNQVKLWWIWNDFTSRWQKILNKKSQNWDWKWEWNQSDSRSKVLRSKRSNSKIFRLLKTCLKNVTQALLSQLILTMDKKLLKKKKCNLDSFVTSLGSANSIFVKNFKFSSTEFFERPTF